jgi:hypothetical protein
MGSCRVGGSRVVGKIERRPGDPYEVGFGKPPKQTRFKKGRSGNPRGRPRKRPDLYSELTKVLHPPHGPTPGLPELDYPCHDRDILVTACGRICMHRKKTDISTVLAGQRLGIKEVDDGIWLVSFMHYDLGYIDLEQRTLQAIDNPFGTRLSPMS